MNPLPNQNGSSRNHIILPQSQLLNVTYPIRPTTNVTVRPNRASIVPAYMSGSSGHQSYGYTNIHANLHPNGAPKNISPAGYGMSNKQWEYDASTLNIARNRAPQSLPSWRTGATSYNAVPPPSNLESTYNTTQMSRYNTPTVLPWQSNQLPTQPNQVLSSQSEVVSQNMTDDNVKALNALIESGLLDKFTEVNSDQKNEAGQSGNIEGFIQKKKRFSDKPPVGTKVLTEEEANALIIERKEGVAKSEDVTEKYLSEKERKSLKAKQLQARALEADFTVEFYEKIKTLVDPKEINNIALDFARKEYARKLKKKFPTKIKGKGTHSCHACRKSYESRDKLKEHYKSDFHTELDDIFSIKKEQARLIMDDELPRPVVGALDTELVAISRAEVEMKLKPNQIDLNTYVLGVYESIMKPYWPKPKSKFYCRICDYREFETDDDLYDHEQTVEHEQREDHYNEAFCLYCQIHLVNAHKMQLHVKSGQHKMIKELMQRTRITAIEHWHTINDKEIPEEFLDEKKKFIEEQEVILKERREKLLKRKKEEIQSKIEKAKRRKEEEKKEKDVEQNKKCVLLKSIAESLKAEAKPKLPDSQTVIKKLVNTLATEQSWFDPVHGFMCIACQKFIPNVTEQKRHANSVQHLTVVQQFKMKAFGTIKIE